MQKMDFFHDSRPWKNHTAKSLTVFERNSFYLLLFDHVSLETV